MTWLLLALITAINSDDMARMKATQRYLDTVIEQQVIQEQSATEQETILQESMTEWFIYRLSTLNNLKYRLGHFDLEEKKFDCVGLFKWYAVERGLLTEEEAGYINSTVMASLGKPKLVQTAMRWDVTFRQPYWGETLRHIAVISRDYNKKDWGLYIMDVLPWAKKPAERLIQLNWGTYLGRWKIKVSSNPFVEIAKHKWLEYKPLWAYEWYFSLSRYYSPMKDQTSYFNGSYASDKDMNCGAGDCLVAAGWYKLKATDAGKVVSCPPELPLWTLLRIEDWVIVKCADRGWSIKNKRLDMRAGIGQTWLDNIKQNKVITWKRNIYKFTYLSKPTTHAKTRLAVIDSFGHYVYRAIHSDERGS